MSSFDDMECFGCNEDDDCYYTTTCIRTDYWEKPCSKKYWTRMYKHELTGKSDDDLLTVEDNVGLIYPIDPKQEWDIPKEHLDRIRVHAKSTYKLTVKIQNIWHENIINKSKYIQTLQNIQKNYCLKIEKLGGWILNDKAAPLEQ